MRLLLPDCGSSRELFWLTPELRRELLLLMAERGEAGIAEFVRRHEKDDSRIAKQIERARQLLMAEAEELRRRLKSDYELRRDAERAKYEGAVGRLRAEEERLAAQRARIDLELPELLGREIRGVPIIQLAIQPPNVAWWRRLYNWLWRFLHGVWTWIRSLFLPHRAAPKAKALAVGIPGVAGPGLAIDLDLETALLSNPDLRRRIRGKMAATTAGRIRRLWRIMWGIESYAEVAKEILEAEARAAATDRARKAHRDSEALDASLAKDRAAEEAARRALQEELARLDAAEAEEARQLRETLARRPLETVRDLVATELEAGGLIERLATGLRMTGHFLDTFAALVYTEEARGLGGVTESALGSSIEGEGILEKTRMLSRFETSHMDTVGTLVQARTNHPHVRHLFDEDVLVYREQRTSLTHLVIVVDQSLSMEENERMTAAKRAALALYYQSRKKGARHRIDFVLMETSVRRASVADVWDAKPKGFTNVGRALQVGYEILAASRANRRVLFLVTDGLPEAVTLDGKDVAAPPDEALKFALRQAARFRSLPGFSASLVLLEAKDPLFVEAAGKIAKRMRGRVTKVEPGELARSLLVQLRQDELVAA